MNNKNKAVEVHEEELIIPTNEGKVSATRFFSEDNNNNTLPVLLMSIPYRKDDWIVYGSYYPLIKYLALNGYHVVVSDVIGTGGSSGARNEYKPYRGQYQTTDVIEWLAEQDWSNGKIGMFGKSHGSRVTLQAAAEQPDPLKAIVPMHGGFKAFDDVKYMGGVLGFFRQAGHFCPMLQMFQALPPSRRDKNGRWADILIERLEGISNNDPLLFKFLENDVKNEYWEGTDLKVEKINIPVFAVTGWRDYYPHAMIEGLSKIDAPTRVLVGPWRHTVPHRGREVTANFRAQVQEWFDYYLKDIDNGAPDHLFIEYWTEREGGGKINQGRWRSANNWPPITSTTDLEYSVTEDGLKQDNSTKNNIKNTVEEQYEIDYTVGLNSYDSLTPPVDTSPDDNRSLRFETEPLESPIELTGTGNATLNLISDNPDPLLVVRVVDVSPDGSSSLVTYGRLRASLRDNTSTIDELANDKNYTIDIPLKPRSHVFEKNHRIRMAISGSLFPATLPPRSQGNFTISSNENNTTGIQFPGKRHNNEIDFDNDITMPSLDESVVPTKSPYIEESDTSWEINRLPMEEGGKFLHSEHKVIDLPHGSKMTWDWEREAGVKSHDPLSAYLETDSHIHFDYGDEDISVSSTSRTTHNITHIGVKVKIDDEIIFSNRWVDSP